MKNLNKLAAEVHEANKHWWHHPATGERLTRDKGEMFMLMVSELSEAMEGERKSLMDDHLPHRRMAEVELADVMIRLLDYAGAKKLNLDGNIKGIYLEEMPDNKGDALLQIVRELAMAREARDEMIHWETWRLCRVVLMVRRYAAWHGYDLEAAIAEKREYNAHRADHKPEARLAANGKKW